MLFQHLIQIFLHRYSCHLEWAYYAYAYNKFNVRCLKSVERFSFHSGQNAASRFTVKRLA